MAAGPGHGKFASSGSRRRTARRPSPGLASVRIPGHQDRRDACRRKVAQLLRAAADDHQRDGLPGGCERSKDLGLPAVQRQTGARCGFARQFLRLAENGHDQSAPGRRPGGRRADRGCPARRSQPAHSARRSRRPGRGSRMPRRSVTLSSAWPRAPCGPIWSRGASARGPMTAMERSCVGTGSASPRFCSSTNVSRATSRAACAGFRRRERRSRDRGSGSMAGLVEEAHDELGPRRTRRTASSTRFRHPAGAHFVGHMLDVRSWPIMSMSTPARIALRPLPLHPRRCRDRSVRGTLAQSEVTKPSKPHCSRSTSSTARDWPWTALR